MLSPLSESREGPPPQLGWQPQAQALLGTAHSELQFHTMIIRQLSSYVGLCFSSKFKLTADWQVKENEKELLDRSNPRQKPALQEVFNATDRSNIVLVFAPLNEGSQSGRVEDTRAFATAVARLQPLLLEGQRSRGTLGRVLLQEETHEILGLLAHSFKVVIWEAKV